MFVRLKYPGKFVKIRDFGKDGLMNVGVDFDSNFKPNFIQMAFISKNTLSSLTVDLDYKESAKKATLTLVKRFLFLHDKFSFVL